MQESVPRIKKAKTKRFRFGCPESQWESENAGIGTGDLDWDPINLESTSNFSSHKP